MTGLTEGDPSGSDLTVQQSNPNQNVEEGGRKAPK